MHERCGPKSAAVDGPPGALGHVFAIGQLWPALGRGLHDHDHTLAATQETRAKDAEYQWRAQVGDWLERTSETLISKQSADRGSVTRDVRGMTERGYWGATNS